MKALRLAAFVAAPTFFLLLFVGVAVLRVGYTYELEWMEGGVLEHVQRVQAGDPLYVAPSLEFVPYIYTPLYFWTAAGVATLLGDGFLPLRLVSLLSSLGCCGLLFLLARRESGSWEVGMVAAGLYAATFEVAGAWLDLARVDALFMLLLLGGIYLARWARGAGGLIAAGVLLGLAFLAKQTALVVALPILLWTVLAHQGAARWACATAFGLFVGGSVFLLQVLSDWWFGYYVFTLPGQHDLLLPVAVLFWTEDVLRPLGWAAMGTVVFLVGARSEQRLFYGLLFVGLMGASYASRLHAGGFLNVLLPAYAGLALGFAFGVQMLWAWTLEQGARTTVLLGVAVLVQFAALFYDPRLQIPTAADRAAGDAVVAALQEVPGDVLVVSHPYLAERAGKGGHAQRMAMYDVWRGLPEHRDRLLDEIHAAIREGRYEAIVLDTPWWGVPEDFEAHYRRAGSVFDQPDVFWQKTGHPTRPEHLYLRRD